MRIRHTGITVRHIPLALRFYRDLLGLKVVKDFVEEGTYIETISGFGNIKLRMVKLVSDNDEMIELLEYEYHQETKVPIRFLHEIGIRHIAFEVDSIMNIYLDLNNAGIKFISEPIVSPDGYAKVAFCKDFDGNLIELVELL